MDDQKCRVESCHPSQTQPKQIYSKMNKDKWHKKITRFVNSWGTRRGSFTCTYVQGDGTTHKQTGQN